MASKNTEFEIEKEGKKEKITIKDYYKQQYKIDIKHEDQPLLIEEIPRNRKNDETKVIRYLIPELCFITGIDELNERDRAEIIAKSKFQPSQKVQKIQQGFNYLMNKEKKRVKKKEKDIELRSPNEIRMEWGINIGDNFVEVEAQCLPIPQLEFGSGKETPLLKNGRFRQQKNYSKISFDQI